MRSRSIGKPKSTPIGYPANRTVETDRTALDCRPAEIWPRSSLRGPGPPPHSTSLGPARSCRLPPARQSRDRRLNFGRPKLPLNEPLSGPRPTQLRGGGLFFHFGGVIGPAGLRRSAQVRALWGARPAGPVLPRSPACRLPPRSERLDRASSIPFVPEPAWPPPSMRPGETGGLSRFPAKVRAPLKPKHLARPSPRDDRRLAGEHEPNSVTRLASIVFPSKLGSGHPNRSRIEAKPADETASIRVHNGIPCASFPFLARPFRGELAGPSRRRPRIWSSGGSPSGTMSGSRFSFVPSYLIG